MFGYSVEHGTRTFNHGALVNGAAELSPLDGSSAVSVMPTFRELGIPFPLFDAPAKQAAEYAGVAACSLCETESECFTLDIGCALMLACPRCGAENGLDANDREAERCRKCETEIDFPLEEDDEILICYRCLRAGRGAITKDTEFGMVSWEQAFAGVTHGVPGLQTAMFPTRPVGDGWIGAVVPREWLFELLRTPTPTTIQGECWHFCCGQPATFIGVWERSDFARHAPDGDGKAYLERLIGESVPGLWEDELHDVTGIYVSRCERCGRETATWDIA